MQRLEVSGAVRPIYGSLGVKRLITDVSGLPIRAVFRGEGELTCCLKNFGIYQLKLPKNSQRTRTCKFDLIIYKLNYVLKYTMNKKLLTGKRSTFKAIMLSYLQF